MDIDFHYYMVRALAEKAGFPANEAQVIAYASQYVDDAIEVRKITVSNLPQIWYGDIKIGDDVIDTVCAAHSDLTYVGGIRAEAQARTYIPFHFLPDKPDHGGQEYDYITRPNGQIARELINKVLGELKAAPGPQERLRELIGLGIAIHSYADTWAHQGFSGLYSEEDNTVLSIEINAKKNASDPDDWRTLTNANESEMKNLLGTTIGHAKAGANPDKSYLRWRYRNRRGVVTRDNPEIFMEAAQTIFGVLKTASGGGGVDWSAIADRVRDCVTRHPDNLSDDDYGATMSQNYKTQFGEIAFAYDKNEWENAALTPGLSVLRQSYRFNGDRKWLYFHVRASEQRKFVLSKIKTLPTLVSGNVLERLRNEWGDVSRNAKNIVEKNAPSFVNRGPIKKFLDWCAPVPTNLGDKGRWIRIKVQNNSQFKIVRTPFQHFDSGRFWEGGEPNDILPFSPMTFGACNADRSLNGVSGAVKFEIVVGADAHPFTIAFTHPVIADLGGTKPVKAVGNVGRELGGMASDLWNRRNPFEGRNFDLNPPSDPSRKCQATFRDDCKGAYEAVGRGERRDEKVLAVQGQTLRLKLFSQPSESGEATVVIDQEVSG